jgi:hypothetical protein
MVERAMIPGRVLLRLVVTGKCYTAKVPGWVMREVAPDGTLGSERVYPVKGIRVNVGGIYTVEAKADDPAVIFPGTLAYEGHWPDQNERGRWYALARAFEAADQARKQGQKEVTRNLISEALEPLRNIYHRTNFQGQVALEVLILTYLRTGRATVTE